MSEPKSMQSSMQSRIHLNFQGYWRDENRSAIPNRPGVFCVYRCRFNAESGTLSARQLLFIGESVNVRHAVDSSAERKRWLAMLKPGEELCFNFAPVILDRKRASIALIHQHQPICNGSIEERALASVQEPTEMLLSGRIQLLNFSFTAFNRKEVSLRTVVPSSEARQVELMNWVEA